jgi:transposase InsO family protein
VNGRVIALSDQRIAEGLGLLEPGETPLERLIERELTLGEVERYSPPEPAAAAIAAGVAAVRARVAPDVWARLLATSGFSEGRLRNWVRDDLRIAAYLTQRFAAVGTPTDQDVAAAFNKRRDEFERAGTSFAEAAPALREALAASRRRELIADWVADLRRRAEVSVLAGGERR